MESGSAPTGNAANGRNTPGNLPSADGAGGQNTAARSARRAHGAAIGSGASRLIRKGRVRVGVEREGMGGIGIIMGIIITISSSAFFAYGADRVVFRAWRAGVAGVLTLSALRACLHSCGGVATSGVS